MGKYYIIQKLYKIEGYYEEYDILDGIVFKTKESVKEYLKEQVGKNPQRNGEWGIGIRGEEDLEYYKVETREEEDDEWEENQYIITELTLGG